MRAARGLLNWSAIRLAEATKVSLSTIQRAEKGSGKTMPVVKQAVVTALEQAGVEFIPGGVRMRRL